MDHLGDRERCGRQQDDGVSNYQEQIVGGPMNIKHINLFKTHLMEVSLDADYPIRFDMEFWADRLPGTITPAGRIFQENHGSTPDYVTYAACDLSGHAVIASNPHLEMWRFSGIRDPGGIPNVAAKWLGLTLHEAAHLFYLWSWSNLLRERYDSGRERDRIIAGLDVLDSICRGIDEGEAEKINNHDVLRVGGRQ